NERHVEAPGDAFDHRLADPAFLALPDPQQRDHRRRLTAGRIFRNLIGHELLVLRIEREGRGLNLFRCETAQTHRSTSPKTMSSEPMMAEKSASMWPLPM